MANAYYHSLSSVKRFGGRYTDYMPIHEWLDASKAITTHFTHRALRHHDYGIQALLRVMDQQRIRRNDGLLVNSDGAVVNVEHVARQHVIEDCGFVPELNEWFDFAEITEKFGSPSSDSHDVAEEVQRQFGGQLCDYLPFATLEKASDWTDRFLFWYHSFGIFTFAEAIGSLVNIANQKYPTRVIAEAWASASVKTKANFFGTIFDARTILLHVRASGNCSWMHGHAEKLSQDRSLRKFADNSVPTGV